MKLRPATEEQRLDVEHAVQSLKDALDHARRADAPRLIAKIVSALKSANGAERHLLRRLAKTSGTP